MLLEKKSDVILGLKNIEDYANDPAYFGAVIGRVLIVSEMHVSH